MGFRVALADWTTSVNGSDSMDTPLRGFSVRSSIYVPSWYGPVLA